MFPQCLPGLHPACPLCLAQRHSWELARLAKEDGVFPGESTAGSLLYHHHCWLLVTNQPPQKLTHDQTLFDLQQGSQIQLTTDILWNLYSAAGMSCFTVCYWWGRQIDSSSYTPLLCNWNCFSLIIPLVSCSTVNSLTHCEQIKSWSEEHSVPRQETVLFSAFGPIMSGKEPTPEEILEMGSSWRKLGEI